MPRTPRGPFQETRDWCVVFQVAHTRSLPHPHLLILPPGANVSHPNFTMTRVLEWVGVLVHNNIYCARKHRTLDYRGLRRDV